MAASRVALIIVAALAASACDHNVAGPGPVETAAVRVRVTEGLAGVDFTYEVSSEGSVLGVACGSGCGFTAGDTLLHLTDAQRGAFIDAVNRSGLPTSGRPVDYGTDCCDQFNFRVTFTSGREIRSFSGSLENMPPSLRTLVEALQSYYHGAPPVLLRQLTGLEAFATDPLTVEAARVEDDALVVEVRYGGGCARHQVDAVAWTGWMESNPVRLGIALTHDDGDDTCKALLSRTLRYDLTPVRQAHAAAYSGGPRTVILEVRSGRAGPVTQVPYTFD